MALTEEESRAYSKDYYSRNRAKKIAAAKKWGKANPSKVKAKQAKFKIANPDYQKIWRENNKDKTKKYNAKPENVEARRIACAGYRKAHPEKAKESDKSWRDRLCDGYIKGMICRYSTLSFKDISQSMIDAKRAQIKGLRFIKEQENERQKD